MVRLPTTNTTKNEVVSTQNNRGAPAEILFVNAIELNGGIILGRHPGKDKTVRLRLSRWIIYSRLRIESLRLLSPIYHKIRCNALKDELKWFAVEKISHVRGNPTYGTAWV